MLKIVIFAYFILLSLFLLFLYRAITVRRRYDLVNKLMPIILKRISYKYHLGDIMPVHEGDELIDGFVLEIDMVCFYYKVKGDPSCHMELISLEDEDGFFVKKLL